MNMKNMPENRLFRGLLGFVFIFAVSFLLLETALRIFDPIGIEYFYELQRYTGNLSRNPDFAYIHTPGYRDKLQDVQVRINSQGFRGPEFPIEKPEGVIRIMILGDSIVFGWGAPEESLFPVRLQKLLNGDEDHVEVISAGVGSWNTRTEYEYLRLQGVKYQPDIIVLVICGNDIEPKLTGQTYVDKERLFPMPEPISYWRYSLNRACGAAVRRSYVLSSLNWVIYRRTVERDQIYGEQSPQWEDAKMALVGIIELCRVRRIHLLGYLYCHDEATSPPFDLYKDVLRSQQVPFFTLPLELCLDRQFKNSIVDGHANASGHRLIAQEMAKALTPILTEIR
jgi:lysophospholipase L1-like esterase